MRERFHERLRRRGALVLDTVQDALLVRLPGTARQTVSTISILTRSFQFVEFFEHLPTKLNVFLHLQLHYLAVVLGAGVPVRLDALQTVAVVQEIVPELTVLAQVAEEPFGTERLSLNDARHRGIRAPIQVGRDTSHARVKLAASKPLGW